jgi:VanZ family protein
MWPALLWALFILIICGIPGHKIPHVDFLKWLKPDKIIHLCVYAVLCYLLIKGFLKQETVASLRNNSKLWAVVLGIAYGVLIEVLQQYVFIDRSGDVFDAMANSVGAFIGLWAFNFIRKKRSVRN